MNDEGSCTVLEGISPRLPWSSRLSVIQVEHGVIDETSCRLIYPCLSTCPFSRCTDFFTQPSARHHSLDQSTAREMRDWWNQIQTQTHTCTFPKDNESYFSQSCSIRGIILIYTNPFILLCPCCVFTVRQHIASKTLLKGCSSSLLWLLSAAMWTCVVMSIFSAWSCI